MKLNLGCGNLRIEGYIGVDFRETKASDLIMDLTEPLEFKNNSIDEVLCAHVIEHLVKADGINLLREIHRILKPDSVLHLHLPLIDYLIENCYRPDMDHFQLISILYGIQRYKGDYHKYGYTTKTISALLAETGFKILEFKTGRLNKPNNKNSAMIRCQKI